MALEKVLIVNLQTGEEFRLLMNPEEYALSGGNSFAEITVPGRGSPLQQFTNGNMRTLDMELLFDAYEARRDVRSVSEPLLRLLKINPETHAPPVLLVVWGSLRFQCVLVKADQRFILFHPDGRPARSRIQVTFNEFTNGTVEAKETKRETANFTKVHVVKRGETLSSIAARVYSNPYMWRPLALRNDVPDPLQLEPGLELAVPRLPFTDSTTGEVYQ